MSCKNSVRQSNGSGPKSSSISVSRGIGDGRIFRFAIRYKTPCAREEMRPSLFAGFQHDEYGAGAVVFLDGDESIAVLRAFHKPGERSGGCVRRGGELNGFAAVGGDWRGGDAVRCGQPHGRIPAEFTEREHYDV